MKRLAILIFVVAFSAGWPSVNMGGGVPVIAASDTFSADFNEGFENTPNTDCTDEDNIDTDNGGGTLDCENQTNPLVPDEDLYVDTTGGYSASEHLRFAAGTSRSSGDSELRWRFKADTVGTGTSLSIFLYGYSNSSSSHPRLYYNGTTDTWGLRCSTGGIFYGSTALGTTELYMVIQQDHDTGDASLYISTTSYVDALSGTAETSCTGAGSAVTVNLWRIYEIDIDTYHMDDVQWGTP